jgi:hypothetical protein
MIADNATSNDKQREDLAAMDNSFEEQNHVRCFNHTLQLSAKALMRPFNPALGRTRDIDFNGGQDDLSGVEDDDNKAYDSDHESDNGRDGFDPYDIDDDDELHDQGPYSREELMEDALVVRTTISKLRQLSFTIIRSTTLALDAWRRYCKEYGLGPRKFPRDVVTRWNSTYDMLSFALDYRQAIDAMTGDKSLKLRTLELEDEEWRIVDDLVKILSVTTVVYHPLMTLTLLHRYTKRQRFISPKILPVSRRLSLSWIGWLRLSNPRMQSRTTLRSLRRWG